MFRGLLISILAASLMAGGAQSQTSKPLMESSVAREGTKVDLIFLKDDRVILRTCESRDLCGLNVVRIENGKLENTGWEWFKHSHLFPKLVLKKYSKCDYPVVSTYDLGSYADTCPQASTGGRFTLVSKLSRRVSAAKRFVEVIGDLASLGMGAAGETDNHQTLSVVDTADGKTCAKWDFNSNDVWEGTQDISPSGKFVARVLGGRLSIYPVPQTCDVP